MDENFDTYDAADLYLNMMKKRQITQLKQVQVTIFVWMTVDRPVPYSACEGP